MRSFLPPGGGPHSHPGPGLFRDPPAVMLRDDVLRPYFITSVQVLTTHEGGRADRGRMGQV